MTCQRIFPVLLAALLPALVLAGASGRPAAAADGTQPATVLHVAPDGKPGAAGTAEAPLSLDAVCARGDIAPGTVIWLRDGAYPMDKVLHIRWKATEQAPIVMRSKPGEWAKLDGGLIVDGDAQYVTLRDFEITRSHDVNTEDPKWWDLPVRERPTYSGQGGLTFKMGGQLIQVMASDHVSLINLYVHDNISGGGFGLWNPGKNILIYGNLLIRNGWDDKGRGHGHGCYIQNGWPEARFGDSIKTFRHNVAAFNHATGMKSYGSAPCIKGTHFEGNVYFGNGMLAWTNGSANYLAGCGKNYMDDIVLKDNFFYQPDSITGDVGGTVYLGWGNKDKRRCVFTGNYVFGGGSAAVLAFNWQNLTFTGNTVYDDKMLFHARADADRMKSWTWNNNTYYNPGAAKPIVGPTGAVTFAEWKQQTGFDADSKWIDTKPSGVQMYVIANEYDPDRAHVVVYNWQKLAEAPIDLGAFLKKGDKFVVYDVLDYRGTPVGQGEFTGDKVKVELRASPIGGEFQTLIVQRFREGDAQWKVAQIAGEVQALLRRGEADAAAAKLKGAGLEGSGLWLRTDALRALWKQFDEARRKDDVAAVRELGEKLIGLQPAADGYYRKQVEAALTGFTARAGQALERGHAALKAGKTTEAARQFQLAVQLTPDSKEAKDALQEIEKRAVWSYNLALNLRRSDPKKALAMIREVAPLLVGQPELHKQAQEELRKLEAGE